MSITGMFEAAGQSTGAAANLGVNIASSMSKSNRAARKIDHADTKALQEGKLGMSEAQKQQMAAGAQMAAQAQQATAKDAIQQAAAASGGQSAASMQALGALGKGAADAGANAAMQANQLSTQQANDRRAQIIARIAARNAKQGAQAQQAGALTQQNIAQGFKGGGETIDTYAGGAGGGASKVMNLFGGAPKADAAGGGA